MPSGPAPAPTDGLWLSATIRQALPPVDRFGWLPSVAITHDRVVLTGGAVPAIFPGPLVTPIVGREISAAGQELILAAARDAGLLSGQTDFTGGGVAPGAVVGVLRLTVDGGVVELIGDPSRVMQCVRAPCDPVPGTPEAFGAFWQRLGDLASWLPGDIGDESHWPPPAYALLVGPAPDPQDLPQRPLDWPLEAPLAMLGAPIGDAIHRCVEVSGAQAAALAPSLGAANQLTPWIQDPHTSATFGLTVRPILAGENVCRDLFGVG